MSKWKRTDTKTREPQGRKGKKRTLETCLSCGKAGHKKADCKFKTATCSNYGKVGSLRAVCRNTNTHEIEKDADEPSPEVIVEAFWCMAVRDIVEDGHCDCIGKHESSEHPDESTNQEKSSRTSESGQKIGKLVTKIEMGEQDRKRRQKSGHE